MALSVLVTWHSIRRAVTAMMMRSLPGRRGGEVP
jgi:hypothetical protein